MSRSAKLSIALVAVAVVLLGVVVLVTGSGDGTDPATTASAQGTDAQLVPDDSIRLADGGPGAPVLVEFLDPECEACRAIKPVVDQLKTDLKGKLTIVVRYMPLHTSSVEAAKAMEAASAQGRFLEMYDEIYATQPQWGEKQTPQRDVFLSMAERLGMDMTAFRAVYDDPATQAKVERDEADGKALGVTGTPTFFLNGNKLELKTVNDLVGPVQKAVGG